MKYEGPRTAEKMAEWAKQKQKETLVQRATGPLDAFDGHLKYRF